MKMAAVCLNDHNTFYILLVILMIPGNNSHFFRQGNMKVKLHINLCIEIQIVRVEWSMKKYLASLFTEALAREICEI